MDCISIGYFVFDESVIILQYLSLVYESDLLWGDSTSLLSASFLKVKNGRSLLADSQLELLSIVLLHSQLQHLSCCVFHIVEF